jgi:hypothetical protein
MRQLGVSQSEANRIHQELLNAPRRTMKGRGIQSPEEIMRQLGVSQSEANRIHQELLNAPRRTMKGRGNHLHTEENIRNVINELGVSRSEAKGILQPVVGLGKPRSRSIRGQKVSQLMRSEGLSLGQASKKLKEMGE